MPACSSVRLKAAAVAVCLSVAAPALADDPPTRVGRIADIEGTVSFRPSADADWGVAVLNYPVAANTAVWVDDNSKVELEIGGARIRLDSDTELDVKQLDDQSIHLSVPQGRIDVTLRGSRTDEHYDVETMRGDVTLSDGSYRIDAGTQQEATRVAAIAGTAEIEFNNQQTAVAQGLEASAGPTEPPVYALAPTTPDGFDNWAGKRDGGVYARPAPAAVPAVPGSDALAQYGTWRTVPDYGPVWTPADVPADWTPYSVGQWSWVAPWGWTWVDAEPWGFAPFHYGRWIELGGAWSWVPVEPGVAVAPGFVPVYAPAMVAFLGNPCSFVSFDGSCVGWVPLGPGEFWQPWFPVGFEYARRVNLLNVNRGFINRLSVGNYRTAGREQPLTNRQAAHVMSATDFAGGRAVQSSSLAVNRAALAHSAQAGDAPVSHLPSPTHGAALSAVSPRGAAARPVSGRPPTHVFTGLANRPSAAQPHPQATPRQAMPQQRNASPPPGYAPRQSAPARQAPTGESQGYRKPGR